MTRRCLACLRLCYRSLPSNNPRDAYYTLHRYQVRCMRWVRRGRLHSIRQGFINRFLCFKHFGNEGTHAIKPGQALCVKGKHRRIERASKQACTQVATSHLPNVAAAHSDLSLSLSLSLSLALRLPFLRAPSHAHPMTMVSGTLSTVVPQVLSLMHSRTE